MCLTMLARAEHIDDLALARVQANHMRGGRAARLAALAALASRRRASRPRALAIAIGSEADVRARPRTWEI